MSVLDEFLKIAHAEVGGAYVFGARGDKCTPDNRRAWASRKPDHPAIVTRCKVLSGTGSCGSCRHNGKRIFDCRGFTWWVLRQATGQSLEGAGCTSQWNYADNWASKGTLDSLPSFPCLLFSQDSKRSSVMAHTGIYDGKGGVIQCGGVGGVGVHFGAIRRSCWSHWALPRSLAKHVEGFEPPWIDIKIIEGQRLMRSDDIKKMQIELKKIGFDVGDKGADGIFGKMTERAVKAYQTSKGLTPTGVVNKALFEQITEQKQAKEPVFYIASLQSLTRAQAEELKHKYPQAVITPPLA